jgi:hypothetical protein
MALIVERRLWWELCWGFFEGDDAVDVGGVLLLVAAAVVVEELVVWPGTSSVMGTGKRRGT